ncbi:MAG: DNA primase [Burkholderiales bacterium]|nr:DNA primase [Burkholderiales bacterium]MCW5605484.1 DNA primase [Burkholderiales bacterium]
MIPQSFIQDLLGRVDIVEVIDRHVKLKRTGSNYAACCPFHTEKSPSFTVSPTKQFYHCFGCGAHGTAIGFMMEYGGLGFVDAVKDLAQSVGMQVPEEARSEQAQRRAGEGQDLYGALLQAAQYYRNRLKDAPRAIDYLKKRGLSGEIAKRFGIGYAPDGWQNLEQVFPDYADRALSAAGLVKQNEEGRRYDVFRDRIMFPIVDVKGNIIGFGGRVLGEGEPKYLNSPETPVFEKGRELYGLFQARRAIRDAGCVIVVEGYMDVVALAQAGVEYAVATLGTATTPVHVQKLLRQSDEVVFCFDGDAAGRRAAWRALENSLAQLADGKQLRFLFLPDGEDPDTYVRKHGKAAFEALLGRADPLSRLLIQELMSRTDVHTSEGRAKLVELAKPLVKQIAAPMLSLLIRKELAQLAGVMPQELDAQFGIHGQPVPVPQRRPTAVRPSILRTMLDLIVCDPQLAALIDRAELASGIELSVPELDREDWKILDPLLQALDQQAEGVKLGEIFRGTPLESAMQLAEARALKIMEQLPSVAEREAEFQDAWQQVLGRIRRFRAARAAVPVVKA